MHGYLAMMLAFLQPTYFRCLAEALSVTSIEVAPSNLNNTGFSAAELIIYRIPGTS